MQLKQYQKKAVDGLLKVSSKVLTKPGTRICVFKSPTGSGKTIMLADWLSEFSKEKSVGEYAFIWLSTNDLHIQSKNKLEMYLKDSCYNLIEMTDVFENSLTENQILFLNWHSLTKQDKQTGEWTNIFMRDNEHDINLPSIINNTKKNGISIILIVDESHQHYWSERSQELVQKIINPKLIIEVSATPYYEPEYEDLINEEVGYEVVKFDDVIAEGMIKKEVLINQNFSKYKDIPTALDEVVIDAAISKQNELLIAYREINSTVKPLLLIQLPSEKISTSALDKSKLEQIESYLYKTHNITVENGKLGIWISERKDNLENIESNDSEASILIFKQAIALGWDCPRAQILVMLRDIKSFTFEIQTVGRILRMPELKHYNNEVLNAAYIYTNLDKISIANDDSSQKYFQVYYSNRKDIYRDMNFPSVHFARLDHGDLTLIFRKIFIEEANKYFGVTIDDIVGGVNKKVEKDIDLNPDNLKIPVIIDVVIDNIDNIDEISGEVVQFNSTEDEIKYKFVEFAKYSSRPFAPVRSHTKIQQAIYDWFDDYLGYKQKSRLEIQRVIVCSKKNQDVFKKIIESAKEKFKEIKIEEIRSKERRYNSEWNVPEEDFYNSLYEDVKYTKSIMLPCYLKVDRNKPEKVFENFLEETQKVVWWYKNGEKKEAYFAIPYFDEDSEIERAFYPDFIVMLDDDRIGIFDTKEGFTAKDDAAKAKSDALQQYIKQNNKLNLFGGIVVNAKTGLFVFTGSDYTYDINQPGWTRLRF